MRMLLPLLGLLALTPPLPGIPEVHAQLLSGTPINFPTDLRGKATVIVIGFSQDSSKEVAGWGQRLAPDYRDAHDIAYYEAAQLEPVPRILRGYVVKKIKETVPQPAQPHFIAVTDHEAEWKAATHFLAKDEAYVLVLDPTGQVRYTTHGPTSDAAYATLKQQLETLRPH